MDANQKVALGGRLRLLAGALSILAIGVFIGRQSNGPGEPSPNAATPSTNAPPSEAVAQDSTGADSTEEQSPTGDLVVTIGDSDTDYWSSFGPAAIRADSKTGWELFDTWRVNVELAAPIYLGDDPHGRITTEQKVSIDRHWNEIGGRGYPRL